jgi:hypothetical protein
MRTRSRKTLNKTKTKAEIIKKNQRQKFEKTQQFLLEKF